ncbi:hypothetical protein DFH27DRAFT_611497 [Peziza echinospora]|nr:hypothetical protein DFH27DRAFT_611497 [Peziza echinospora]
MFIPFIPFAAAARLPRRVEILLAIFASLTVKVAAAPVSPPVWQASPIPRYNAVNQWCSTDKVDAVSNPLVRLGMYLLIGSVFLAKYVAPSAQPVLLILGSIIVITLSFLLLVHSNSNTHPMALELFMVSNLTFAFFLISRPRGIPRLLTHINAGITILCFVAQLASALILGSIQIFISSSKMRTVGMDFNKYEITRHRNSDLVPDSSTLEYVYTGERVCGRYAQIGTSKIDLASPWYNGTMIVCAVMLMVYWIAIIPIWLREILIFFYIMERPNPSLVLAKKTEIKDCLPAVANLQGVFQNGDIPEKTPSLEDTYVEVGLQELKEGWAKKAHEDFGVQMVFLEKTKRYIQGSYGFENPVNMGVLEVIASIVIFGFSIASCELTIAKHNILYGGETSPLSRRGWQSQVVFDSNGIIFLVIGTFAVATVIAGWAGDRGIWRIYEKIGDRIAVDSGRRVPKSATAPNITLYEGI